MDRIRAIIVDDEPLAREGLALQLAQAADVQVVGVCAGGAEAVRAIDDDCPDVVFLDIEMPGVGGFDVIRSVGVERMPFVVFVTAYAEHAVEAFEFHAMDYLLKPVRESRLRVSLDRLRANLAQQNMTAQSEKLGALLARLDGQAGTAPTDRLDNGDRIVVRSYGRVHFLPAGDVLWVEAAGDFVTLHCRERSHLLRETMRNMERRLEPHGFRRVHRSAIVNLRCVRELRLDRSKAYHVILTDDTALSLGRSYRDAVYAALAGPDD